jgi:hypothetical protein
VESSSPLQVLVDGTTLPSAFAMVEMIEFLTGDRVRVRNQSSEAWAIGTVVSELPLQVLVDGSSSPSEFATVEGTPFLTGGRVRVRNTASEAWQNGTVVSLLPLEVVVDGSSSPSEFAMVEETNEVQYQVGDRVRVRNQPSESWSRGTVVSVEPLQVLVDDLSTPAEVANVQRISGNSTDSTLLVAPDALPLLGRFRRRGFVVVAGRPRRRCQRVRREDGSWRRSCRMAWR